MPTALKGNDNPGGGDGINSVGRMLKVRIEVPDGGASEEGCVISSTLGPKRKRKTRKARAAKIWIPEWKVPKWQ